MYWTLSVCVYVVFSFHLTLSEGVACTYKAEKPTKQLSNAHTLTHAHIHTYLRMWTLIFKSKKAIVSTYSFAQSISHTIETDARRLGCFSWGQTKWQTVTDNRALCRFYACVHWSSLNCIHILNLYSRIRRSTHTQQVCIHTQILVCLLCISCHILSFQSLISSIKFSFGLF